MLSLSSAFINAFTTGTFEIVRLVTIDLGGNELYRFCSGHRPLRFGLADMIPCSVSRVAPVASEIDPWTREFTVGDVEIEFVDDGLMRELASTKPLRGKKVTVALGERSLATTAYLTTWTGIIEDVVAEPGKVRMTCVDVGGILADQEIAPKDTDLLYVGSATGLTTGRTIRALSWTAMHPLAVLRDLLRRAEVDSSLYDVNSMDEARGEHSAIAHWSVSRTGWHEVDKNFQKAIVEPVKAKDLVDDLCRILGGGFVPGENGALAFKRFDSNAPVVRHWTADDIGDVDPVEGDGNAKNKVTVRFLKHEEASGKEGTGYVCTVEAEDATAQQRAAYAGQAKRVLEAEVESDWLNAEAQLVDDISAGDTAIVIQHPVYAGFCGARYSPPLTTQYPWEQLINGRLTVLKIESEYLICTAFAGNTAIQQRVRNATKVNYVGQGTFTAGQRGAFGTTAAAHKGGNSAAGGARVRDYTIGFEMAYSRLRRWYAGVPIIKVPTSIAEIGVQVGDFVTLPDSVYLAYGFDGLDASTVWEVISKEEAADDDSPQIMWTLARARIDSQEKRPPQTTITVRPPIERVRVELSSDRLAFGNHITSKFVAAGGASEGSDPLARTIGSAAIIAHDRYVRPPPLDLTMTVSKDTWVSYDLYSGQYVVREQTLGDPEPTWMDSEVPLYKYVTDGTSITSTVDHRPTSSGAAVTDFTNLGGGVGTYDSMDGTTAQMRSIISPDGSIAVVLDGANGEIEIQTAVPTSVDRLFLEGDGHDGAFGALSGAVARDLTQATSVTTAGTVTPVVLSGKQGAILLCRGTLTIAGGTNINADGLGGNGSSGGAIDETTIATNSAIAAAGAGAGSSSGAPQGGNGTGGTTGGTCQGGTGGGGGGGSTFTGGGTGSAGANWQAQPVTALDVAQEPRLFWMPITIPAEDWAAGAPPTLVCGAGGSKGGNGGAGYGDGGTSAGGTGGNGGPGGGFWFVGVRELAGTGTLRANGSNGVGGTNGATQAAGTNAGGGGSGAGGGGGGGGAVIVKAVTIGGGVTLQANGGTGAASGDPGTGKGTGLPGGDGGAGGNGGAGRVVTVDL